jgi:glycosyltransferase involved in cell wall biosynthesis
VQNGYLKDRRALRWITRNSAIVIVCTTEERQRLINLSPGSPVAVIPHFVERRQPQLTPQTAKMTVGLEKFKVVVLAGFIFPGKGHEVALEALKQLPAQYFLVFAGGSSVGQDSYVQSLRQQARLLGVEDRLYITGGLSDTDMENYLLAADVAICPFMQMGASGSLSTWLSVGTAPIIASDLPQIQWYNAMVPGAIAVFPAGDHRALAGWISNANGDSGRAARLRLRDLLSVTRIVDEHLGLYRNLLAGRHAACDNFPPT